MLVRVIGVLLLLLVQFELLRRHYCRGRISSRISGGVRVLLLLLCVCGGLRRRVRRQEGHVRLRLLLLSSWEGRNC